MAAICQWLVCPVSWFPGLRPGVSRFAGPTLAPLRCPLPSSVQRSCHVLDQEEHTGPWHFRAEVRWPERAVPGWLPCLYRPPPWGAGVEARVPLLSQMCPAGVLSPTSEPAGPSTRVSPSELPGRTDAAPDLSLRRLQAHGCRRDRSVPRRSPELRPSLPRRVGQEGGWPGRQSSWLQKVLNAHRYSFVWKC